MDIAALVVTETSRKVTFGAPAIILMLFVSLVPTTM